MQEGTKIFKLSLEIDDDKISYLLIGSRYIHNFLGAFRVVFETDNHNDR